MTKPVPDTIGRFKIESRLGSGGMGEVYRALDPTLRRTVAIKTVRPDIDNPMYLDRLYREAQAIARLQHPNIVTVYEAGETSGLVYIAMEFLKGENLAAALDRADLTFEARIRMVMQILEALHYAHSEGVIHRDIKPANVHRLPDGTIKLLDFGLARMTRTESLTQSGAVMGTPYYASPEQLMGEEVDGRTDVYSAGVLAYELFTGRRAFEGENLSTVILKVLSTAPPPMETSWAKAFPEIERIVSRAVAKSAADRYATAEDMRNALASFLSVSRDALASLHAEQTIVSQRAVMDAKTLIASGAVTRARALLAGTLRAYPEAVEARALLKETDDSTIVQERPANLPAPAAMTAAENGSASATLSVPGILPASPPAPAPSPLLPPPPVRAAGAGAQPGAPASAAPRRALFAVVASAAVLLAVAAGWTATRAKGTPPDAAAVAPAWASNAASAPPVVKNEAPPAAKSEAPPDSPAVAATTPTEAPAVKRESAAPPRNNAAHTSASSSAATSGAGASTVNPEPGAVPARDSGAKKLFVERASHNPGLRYGILHLRADNTEAEVDPDTTFHTGDRVRFSFEPNIDGYLYLVQQGSSGRWNVLFPNPQISGGTNAVQRGQRVSIPSEGWFKFDDTAGTENAFVLLSREPLSTLPGFNQPVTKMESIGPSLVDELKRGVNPRDLVFEKDPGPPGGRHQAAFVVNRDELAKYVSATIQLVHR
jgi:hypothetical protein